MDEVFDFKDLIFHIVRKWRLVISAAIVFAATAGIWSARSAPESPEFRHGPETAEAYASESVMMLIDPYDVHTGVMTFFVKSQDEDLNARLEKERGISALYKSLLNTKELYESIKEGANIDIPAHRFRELVSLSEPGNFQELISLSGPDNIFTVSTVSNSPELTSRIIERISRYFKEQRQYINQHIGDHTLEIVAQSNYSGIDLTIESHQDKVKKSVNIIKSAGQRKVGAKGAAGTTGVILYGVLGGIGGLGAGVLLLLFFDSARMVIRSDKELRGKYGLRFLGRISKG